jgi:hypothetical protein
LVDLPFFHADVVNSLITSAIDLALIYHVDPFTFLERPAHEIDELYRITGERLKAMRPQE